MNGPAQIQILVPFWGNHPDYRRWLDEWLEHYRQSGCNAPVTIISDDVLPVEIPAVKCQLDCRAYQDLVDPRYPYDRKAAIVCAALLHFEGPLLVLDADAWLVGDPIPLVESFINEPIAMPADEGAFGKRYPGPHDMIVRRCAGVIFFGAPRRNVRIRLIERYRERFLALRELIATGAMPEERRLLEQHAWTFVADLFGTPVLPRELNWPACFVHAGENPAAVIHHHIGKRKWINAEAAPTPGLLNDGQLKSLARV